MLQGEGGEEVEVTVEDLSDSLVCSPAHVLQQQMTIISNIRRRLTVSEVGRADSCGTATMTASVCSPYCLWHTKTRLLDHNNGDAAAAMMRSWTHPDSV